MPPACPSAIFSEIFTLPPMVVFPVSGESS
nr:MAG TPA: hypothetical protein [Caudoviricetes sp.]